MYNIASLCIFCNQFFDADYGEIIESASLESKEILSPVNVGAVTNPRGESRPLSRMKIGLAMQRLKDIANTGIQGRYKRIGSTVIDEKKVGNFLRTK